MIRCSFCGYEFEQSEAETACGGCPLVRGCHLIRCPRCGYEMPPPSALLRRLDAWREKTRQKGQQNVAPK